MDFLLEKFKISGIDKIRELYTNLKKNGILRLNKVNFECKTLLKFNTYDIFNNIYEIIKNQKEMINNGSINKKIKKRKRIFLRNFNYLNNQITSGKLLNGALKYKLSNKNNVINLNLFLLVYIIIFYFQISSQNSDKINSENKYLLIKLLYNILKKISSIISKLYLDKLLDLEQLEIIIKTLIILSINNSYNIEIKDNNNLENIMYLKQSLKIIKIIFNLNSSEQEQIFLINIFKYINRIICHLDIDNNIINYTNKFYMINNDSKTTKLLNFMNIIYKINNKELNKAYFELINNIYNFQFNYNNFIGPFYKLLEPLLVNINKKNYSEILEEVSFPEFQLNFIMDLREKEKKLLEKYPNTLKNGFYFGEKSKNSGIIAYLDKIQDNFILNFGFKLILTKELKKNNEFILLLFKNTNDNKTLLKICITKEKDNYFMELINHKDNHWKIFQIIPFEYYIYSLQFKDSIIYVSLSCDNHDEIIPFEVHKMHYKLGNNLVLCVGCDIEQNKNNKDNTDKSINYIFKNKFVGFIGDIHIINIKSFKSENLPTNIKYEENEKGKKILRKIDISFLQRNFLNLKGKYGFSIMKSVLDQKHFNEFILTNIEDSTKIIKDKDDANDFFRVLFKEEDLADKKVYKLIDNVVLYISSFNFKLINYMDSIDYLNYDNYYYEKEKDLYKYKKEYQFLNNFRIKRNEYNNKKIIINRNLFNCNFNIFENKSGLLKFVEQDGIFYLLLILEYYYQIICKICFDLSELDKNNNKDNDRIILSDEQKSILKFIEKGIENIINFFYKKILYSKIINLKVYMTKLFYYQGNVVLKQFLLLQNINDNIFKLLIMFLKHYHNFINKNINTRRVDIDFPVTARNFFFDFLLNPTLYKNCENFNLLKNLDYLHGEFNLIIEDNLKNDELINKKICNKLLLLLVLVFKLNENDFIASENNNINEEFLKLKKNMLFY